MVPTVPSANSMVILLPSSAPTGQAVPVSTVQAPMTAALPLQTTGTTAPPLLLPPTVPLAPQLVLPVPPQMPAAPGNMVPLLVSTQGDTKLMLVPQEVMKNKDPTTLQKMVIAATSVQSQPQATSTPSGAKVNILPKPINTTPKAIKKSPKIPMPKITPAMRRAAAAGLLPSSTIDLTESQETDDKGTESSTDLTETLHKEAIVSTDGFFDPYSLGMRRGCCYVGCKAEPSPQNPLYTFPVDPERRKAWLRACGRDESLGREWLQICKSHFSDESFHEMGYMLPNAVPHQNPLKAPTKVYLLQNKHGQRYTEIELTCPKRREDGMFPCAVLKCHSCYHKDSDEYKMYRFPNPEDEPDRFRAWYELVSHPTLRYSHQVLYEEFVVCERHFEKIYFKNGEKSQGLCDIAIPTWMVPGKRSLKILDYYKKTVEPYLKDIGKVTVELAESEEVSLEENLKTVCVLEKDRLNFLGMGSCLKFTKHELNKLGFSMYKMTKNVYAAIYDLEEGESIKVHTAIIIDDNDTCEKAVLRQILDSHLADEPKPALERA
ncbi:unnamed protein product [Acanthoscelides obtectus]|uniref:THAP-type domain-containing protein n=1 Tax=Acanthoscelides obtectus TaxID=200917 RepID=A0A9P0LNG1_ACAOB|nr:unnamed protein product [Acanthoscelides obtectus]CAK1621467.1 hypothetical protein AOBTE_LOCUS978 [Acanthoscelides obtectus]